MKKQDFWFWKILTNVKSSPHSEPFYLFFVTFFFLLFSPENPGCDHSAGLRQDWQERRHWEDPGGKQVHRGRAETLVRHAGQPPSPHRPVASAAAGGGGGCRCRSPKCQEVKLPPEHIAAPPPNPTSSSTHLPHAFPTIIPPANPPPPGPTYQCIFQKEHP